MKTTTQIIQHSLKLYYLDLATDGKISLEKLDAKSKRVRKFLQVIFVMATSIGGMKI